MSGYNYSKMVEALHSGEPNKVVDVLLAIAFNNDDLAILCFGHLARIHGELELYKVLPIVRNALDDPDQFVRSHATSALDDIQFFLNSH
jgi:HEAT repeat protein